MLTDEQVASFHRDGWLVMADAVTGEQLAGLQADFAAWSEESRSHPHPWDHDTADGRPRFDMAAGHSAEQPLLRRVNDQVAV